MRNQERPAWYSVILSICCLLTLVSTSYADQSKMKTINRQIKAVRSDLKRDQKTRRQYVLNLKRLEVKAAHLDDKLRVVGKQLKQQKQKLSVLRTQAETYHQQLTQQQSSLKQQIRAVYVFGQQPFLKLLLNQTVAEHFNRMLTYYHYIGKQETQMVGKLQDTLQQIASNQQAIASQTQQLLTLQTEQQQQKANLKQLAEERQKMIHQYSLRIQSKNKRLAQLMANRRLLENTLNRIEKTQAIKQIMHQNFKRLRGKLPWPTQGKIHPYFGTKIYQSELRWNGILISANANQPVRAVANGEVVFANWLAGYGLLVIINHGHGYLTLYGRNRNLYKKVGAYVQKGDIIATVGNSGGYQKTALYFAIRHNVTPLNPMQWCR